LKIIVAKKKEEKKISQGESFGVNLIFVGVSFITSGGKIGIKWGGKDDLEKVK
jgi:hypothetical protein